jgi:lysophospholipase
VVPANERETGRVRGVLVPPREDGFEQFARDVLMPYFDSLSRSTFLGRNGVTLSWLHAPAQLPHESVDAEPALEPCAVVIVPGRTESYFKYAETIYDLTRAGHEVFAYDHRGQGFSERLLADPQVGYVRDFDDYVSDLRTFLRVVVQEHKRAAQSVLLAHSMGAAISLLLCRAAVQPSSKAEPVLPFQGAILSAPMLEIKFDLPAILIEAAVSLRCLLGKDTAYATEPGPFDATTYGEDLSSSKARLAWYRRGLQERPQLHLGMPSNQWMKEALRASADLRRSLAKEGAQIPLLLLAPGQDSVVETARQELLSRFHRGDVLEVINLPLAKHDAFIETDAIRGKAMNAVFSFLELFSTPVSRPHSGTDSVSAERRVP